MNWLAIFKREIRHMFITDRRRAIFIFGAPLAYLLLFSLLYGTHTVKSVPLIIYDEDQTQFSRSLIQAFDDSERFNMIAAITTQEEMEDALLEKEAYAAVHIPKNFTRDVKFGRSSTVLLIADGGNIIITNTITNAAQEILANFSTETGAKLTEISSGQLPTKAQKQTTPIEFRLRVLNNPTQSYLSFFVIGLAMASFQQGVFLAVGASIVGEYKNPADLKNSSALSIIVGKLLPYLLSATLAFFITIITAIYGFSIPFKGSLTNLLLLSEAFILAAIGFSTCIAALCDKELTFTRLSIAYTVPAFVLSGYTWPQEAMDIVGKTISYTFPLSYFSNTLRELMIAGYSPVLYTNTCILFSIGILFISMGATYYIKKLKRLHST